MIHLCKKKEKENTCISKTFKNGTIDNIYGSITAKIQLDFLTYYMYIYNPIVCESK